VLGAINQMREERQPAKESRTQHDASQYFANHFRLTQLNEQVTEELGKSDQEEKNE
jgi:ABC-type Zn uptake system ZnuABC Zn-binding protein ZnuA